MTPSVPPAGRGHLNKLLPCFSEQYKLWRALYEKKLPIVGYTVSRRIFRQSDKADFLQAGVLGAGEGVGDGVVAGFAVGAQV